MYGNLIHCCSFLFSGVDDVPLVVGSFKIGRRMVFLGCRLQDEHEMLIFGWQVTLVRIHACFPYLHSGGLSDSKDIALECYTTTRKLFSVRYKLKGDGLIPMMCRQVINGRAERFVGLKFDFSRYHLLCICLKTNSYSNIGQLRMGGWVLVKHPMMSKGNEIYIDFLQSKCLVLGIWGYAIKAQVVNR